MNDELNSYQRGYQTGMDETLLAIKLFVTHCERSVADGEAAIDDVVVAACNSILLLDAPKTHWISKSDVRHNESCKLYGTGRGSPCRADEGSPCSRCGG